MKFKKIDDKSFINAIFNSSAEAILVVSVDGKILDNNKKADELFAYHPEEMKGLPLEKLIPNRYRKIHSGHMHWYQGNPKQRSMAEGSQLFALRKNGTEFQIKVSLSPIKDDEELLFIVALVLDITEQEKAKEELKRANEELESNVEARTKELQDLVLQLEEKNIELNKTQEEVTNSLNKEKQLNELKSRFVSTASHEFRTPLSTVLSSVSLLERYNEAEQKDKRLKHIEKIKNSVLNLNSILDEFLSLDRIEEGKINLNLTALDIKELSEEILDQFSELLKKGQHIQYKHEGNRIIISDVNALRHIIINILSNALKYSKENSEVIFTTAVDQNSFVINITDSGIGIPEDEQDNMFEKFFRAKNVTNIQGTGLGLHIVKRFVDLLDGEIDLKSEYEKGTAVTVKLPLQ